MNPFSHTMQEMVLAYAQEDLANAKKFGTSYRGPEISEPLEPKIMAPKKDKTAIARRFILSGSPVTIIYELCAAYPAIRLSAEIVGELVWREG